MSVGFGTDLMGLLEDEQLNGLRLQAEAGEIWTALASATSVNAELIGRPYPPGSASAPPLPGGTSQKPRPCWQPAPRSCAGR